MDPLPSISLGALVYFVTFVTALIAQHTFIQIRLFFRRFKKTEHPTKLSAKRTEGFLEEKTQTTEGIWGKLEVKSQCLVFS